MIAWFHRLAVALRGRFPRGREDRFAFRCPVHRDRRPSGWAYLGRTAAVVKCMACHGCTTGQIVRAVGLTMSDLFPPETGARKKWEPEVKRHIVATYDYRAPDGTLLYQAVRWEPKGFSRRRPGTPGAPGVDGDGWVWMLEPGTRRVPYRLPELLEHPEWPVVVVEGEKDADRLASLGLSVCPTTSIGGAGDWQDCYGVWLCGRRVVVIPDHDWPGLRYADAVFGCAHRHGAVSGRIVPLWPADDVRTSHGPDLSDWLDRGHTAAELVELIKGRRPWEERAA